MVAAGRPTSSQYLSRQGITYYYYYQQHNSFPHQSNSTVLHHSLVMISTYGMFVLYATFAPCSCHCQNSSKMPCYCYWLALLRLQGLHKWFQAFFQFQLFILPLEIRLKIRLKAGRKPSEIPLELEPSNQLKL